MIIGCAFSVQWGLVYLLFLNGILSDTSVFIFHLAIPFVFEWFLLVCSILQEVLSDL